MRFFMLLWVGSLVIPFVQAQENLPFPNSQFTEIGGLHLHYRSWDPVDSITGQVLLVHGFCGSTFSWRHNVDTLVQQGYRVLAVDVPPFGYSDRKRGVNHAPSFQAILLWGLIDQLSFGEAGWNLIGHSMGAAIVGAMAAMRPQQTARVICVDGTLLRARADAGPWLRRILAAGISQGLVNMVARIHYFRPRKLRKILASAYATAPSDEALSGYRAPLLLRHTASGIFDLYARAKAMFPYSERDVKAPVVIIWGEKDVWIPLETGEAFAQVLPRASFHTFPTAGHCPMETHAPAFNRLIGISLK